MSEDPDVMKYDWYAVLGCNSESTKSFIEKAARKLFLKYHPDKTSDPKAPELFLRVQKAKEILLDDTKRKAIDEAKVLVTKRQDYENERSKNMDVKRKRMRDELEAMLEKGKKPSAGSARQNAERGVDEKRDQSDNINRLRKEGASLREATARDAESKEAQRVYEALKEKKAQEKKLDVDGGVCQIKIKWKRNRQSHSDESLALLFKTFGDIEQVTMIGDKGNAATILFSRELSAASAVAEYAASTEYRVTIPFNDTQDGKKRAAIFTHAYSSSAAEPYRGAEIFSTKESDSTQESDLMRSMRRAVEREELIRSLNGEEHSSNSGPKSNPSDSRSISAASIGLSKGSAEGDSQTGVGGKAPSAVEVVTVASLALKEEDVLKRMMEAAVAKKKAKLAKAAAATAETASV